MNENKENFETEQAEVEVETAEQESVSQDHELEEVDPLADAIERVQELEELLAAAVKTNQEIELRSRAEVDNIRRRVEQDVEKAHKFALEKFAKELITVIDNLERAAEVKTDSSDESVKSLFEGIELTLKDFISMVAKFGITADGVVGETFNPELHQAIAMQPTEGFSTNQITQVLQKGYLLNGRVIRPAMVMVAA